MHFDGANGILHVKYIIQLSGLASFLLWMKAIWGTVSISKIEITQTGSTLQATSGTDAPYIRYSFIADYDGGETITPVGMSSGSVPPSVLALKRGTGVEPTIRIPKRSWIGGYFFWWLRLSKYKSSNRAKSRDDEKSDFKLLRSINKHNICIPCFNQMNHS